MARRNPVALSLPEPRGTASALLERSRFAVRGLVARPPRRHGQYGGLADPATADPSPDAPDDPDLLDASDAQIGVTDCPTCELQMRQFGKKRIVHPVEVLEWSSGAL